MTKVHVLEVEELVEYQEYGHHYIDGKHYKILPDTVKVAYAIL